ncbi:DUF4143 domain-containing protein [Sphingopyxis sp.]|uniref:DUF4143 domain-containing protein n=1 Tax=Sphingopyxis sp. TaxID=1908224 RepID=UPI00344D7DE4
MPRRLRAISILLVDLLLVRRLEPWHSNAGKRLVKSPRIYVRDSGLAYALLGLTTSEDILGHPIAGPSWEGLVVETPDCRRTRRHACQFLPDVRRCRNRPRADAARRCALGRRDLRKPAARSWNAALTKPVTISEPARRLLIYPGSETYPLGGGVEVMPLVKASEALLATH